MQIIHCSPYRDADGKPRKDVKKEAALALGPKWMDILKAEDAVIETLGDNIDDEYTFICNANLLGDGPDADAILVGPNGVWVMEFIPGKGMYKAEGERWFVYDNKKMDYQLVDPNPIVAARDNANGLYDYLHSKDLPIPWVNPVLILTASDVTLNAEDTAATFLKPDEVQQFAMQDVCNLEPVMDDTDAAMIVETLRPFFGAPPPPAVALDEDREVPTTFLGMTTTQWVIIFVLALLNICVLGGFAAFVIFNSSQP
jgi:hypothetical protein